MAEELYTKIRVSGLESEYKPESEHKDTIYFATDTKKIYYNGSPYTLRLPDTWIELFDALELSYFYVTGGGVQYNEDSCEIILPVKGPNLAELGQEEKLVINEANDRKAGVMSAQDKAILNQIFDKYSPIYSIFTRSQSDEKYINLPYLQYKPNAEQTQQGGQLTIYPATTEYAGGMTAEDKTKLDGIAMNFKVLDSAYKLLADYTSLYNYNQAHDKWHQQSDLTISNSDSVLDALAKIVRRLEKLENK